MEMEKKLEARLSKCESMIQKLGKYVEMPMEEDYAEKEEESKEESGNKGLDILMQKEEL